MVPLLRRAAVGTALVAAALTVTTPFAAADGDGDGRGDHRAEARILDGVPLPPGAEATRLKDRGREYVVATAGTQVLAWFRTALPNAGWTERDPARPQRLRAVFTRADARLTIVVLDPSGPDAQSPAGAAIDTSDLRVRVRTR